MSEDNYQTPFTSKSAAFGGGSQDARSSAAASSKDDFSGPVVPLQVRIPQDLQQSLRLHSIQQNRSISEIVLECLTTKEVVPKAWVSTRRAG